VDNRPRLYTENITNAEIKEAKCMGQDLDPAGLHFSRGVRNYVYWTLIFATQSFMSYDGSATPVAMATLKKLSILERDECLLTGKSTAACQELVWTEADIANLGTFSPLGMAVSALFWGKILQMFPAKILLVLNFAGNIAATITFAFFYDRKSLWYMIACKAVMGITQGFTATWSAAWIINYAMPDVKGMWFGLLMVSAGTGGFIATLVTGATTVWSYSFTFLVQAGGLTVIFTALLFTPQRNLTTKMPDDILVLMKAIAKDSEVEVKDSKSDTLKVQIKRLWGTKLFVWGCCVLMLNQFMQSGLFFWFAQTFNNEYTWELEPYISSILQCVVQLAGSCTGMFFLMQWCEKVSGNGATVLSQLKMLYFHIRANAFGAFFGILCCVFFYIKTFAQFGSLLTLPSTYSGTLTAEQRTQCQKGGGTIDALLIFIFVCIAALMAMTVGSDGHMSGISLGAVSTDLQEFASGPQQAIKQSGDMLARFLVGNGYMGVISALWRMDEQGQQSAPESVKADAATYAQWVSDMSCLSGSADARKLYYGYALMTLTFVLMPFFYWRAMLPVRASLKNMQVKARDSIQDALRIETGHDPAAKKEKLRAIEQAIATAKRAELQANEQLGGENLLGHANHVLGQLEGDLISNKTTRKGIDSAVVIDSPNESSVPDSCSKVVVPVDPCSKAAAELDSKALVAANSEIERLKAENASLLAEVRRLQRFEVEAAQLRNDYAQLKEEQKSPRSATKNICCL
jgi:MFS family permease